MTTHDPAEADTAADDFDPLAELTIAEIDAGSRHLKASLVHAITEQTADYGKALAVTLWLHKRRVEPGAQLAPLLQLTYTQLAAQLGELAPAEAGPTPPGTG